MSSILWIILIVMVLVFLLLLISVIRSEADHKNRTRASKESKTFYRWD